METLEEERTRALKKMKKDPDQQNSIPEFTINEIQDANDRLKKGKAKDSNGVRAEQLKNCSDATKEKIRTIFNETNSSTRKVTEKMQIITGQFAACQYYTSYSLL